MYLSVLSINLHSINDIFCLFYKIICVSYLQFVFQNHVIHRSNNDTGTDTNRVAFRSPGVGVTKAISSVPLISPIFHHCQNTGYLLNIMFIFDRCCRSSAAVTPVKYQCDTNNLAGTSARSKINFAYREINERSFSNPHPRTRQCHMHLSSENFGYGKQITKAINEISSDSITKHFHA